MDVDPLEYAEEPAEEAKAPRTEQKNLLHWLNTTVAITIALLASFMGICKVKDDNIVQAMQQAQADKIDAWNWYQARHLREDLALSNTTQLKLQEQSAPASLHAVYEKQIAAGTAMAKEQREKMKKLQQDADGLQNRYDELNYHDDQFDLSDAALTIAITLLAVTALMQKRWLYWISLAPAVFGIIMGIAGLAGLHIHPDMLAKMLGT